MALCVYVLVRVVCVCVRVCACACFTVLLCAQNQYHFLYIAAKSMADLAITEGVTPDKPTAPKPTVSPHLVQRLF